MVNFLQLQVDKALVTALEEDVGTGDITTLATIAPTAQYQGHFLAKADGIVAGVAVMQRAFELVSADIETAILIPDGSRVQHGDIIATATGPGQALLTGERVALNFMQRMSGIATATAQMMAAVAHTDCIILDTRKTVPGLRHLDKWAVRIGGGRNHRMGLHDMVLIKDNHIEAAGGITAAVDRVRAHDPLKRPIEVEVADLIQLGEALPLQVDRIMLDNMSLTAMREAVVRTAGQTPLEASGNVRLETVAAIAETGVDYISSGALTHSVTALDISFKLRPTAQ